MFKKTLLVLLVALSVFSCQKNVDETAALQEVSFSAIELTPDIGLKSTDSTIVCKNDVPDYAAALISVGGADTWYYPALFTLDGKIYTQSIKLPVGTYTVKEFFLYKNEGGTTGYEAGDIIVFATPNSTGQYKEYVTNPTTFTFAVEAFKKAQVDIEVLCFQDHLFTDFGFNWFAVTEIVVRQFCFFGDICITDANAAAFAGSIYATGGLNPDEEAVFRVIVKNNGVETPYSPFSNEAIYNTGKALCVDYPDNLSEVNNFTFELQIWVPSTVPGTFVWQTYTTFTSTDAGNLFYGNVDLGDNTIVKSFAVGTCSPDSNPIFTWLAPIAPPVPACDPFQGFEINTDGWNNGYGVATRVASGTGGITAATGDYFGLFTPVAGTIDDAPFTRYCAYSCEWTNGWYSVMDVYLDVNWAVGQGFDFSTAINKSSDCSHLRDFIWHVGHVDGLGLLINASNNTDFVFNSAKLLNNNNGVYYTVPSTGWYTFKTVFTESNDGHLSVDFILYQKGNPVALNTINITTTDLVTDVSGHRYGWFTYIDVTNGIAIDNTDLVE